ncbi:hypothetical protein [Asaia krungthepensis]|uniref:Uncharacterized protein n=1 Tax=Asaia krungthepensis NRIC 0535 TaxID=1307925 RepID=A0ABQ0Q4K0_9PROT|nr:hypothetical protein [Asaia krungthepensis]GBQ91150.1 hypothetical protein AA0535_2219 [Asaia krungthepensis NRIC 0535]
MIMREGIETGELGERSATSGVKDRFEILVVTKLTHIGQTVADIHRLVSPSEDDTGDKLVGVMSRIADGIENLGVTLQEITGQLDRVEERIDVVEMAVRPAPTR